MYTHRPCAVEKKREHLLRPMKLACAHRTRLRPRGPADPLRPESRREL